MIDKKQIMDQSNTYWEIVKLFDTVRIGSKRGLSLKKKKGRKLILVVDGRSEKLDMIEGIYGKSISIRMEEISKESKVESDIIVDSGRSWREVNLEEDNNEIITLVEEKKTVIL